MAGGRPTDYSIELATKICAQLAEGNSLVSICKEEGMPSCVSVYAWLNKHEEFLKMYTRAKEDQADYLAEEMLDIADDATNDYMEEHDKEGGNVGWKLNGEHINRSRLRIETRKWIAAKLKPKKYGDKVEHEHKGNVTLTLGNDDAKI